MIHISKCLILAHSIPYSDFNTEASGRSRIYFWTFGQYLIPYRNGHLFLGFLGCDIKI